MGALSNPSIPKIPGLAEFDGKLFHSAQWDHDYDLNGKRIAVIGTGASEIKFVPQIVPKVAHLALFQRTPHWTKPKPARELSELARQLFRLLTITQNIDHPGLTTPLQ